MLAVEGGRVVVLSDGEAYARRMSREARYAELRRDGLVLVGEDGGRSLWTRRGPATYGDYWHVVGRLRTHIGGFRSDADALEHWARIVDAERNAWGR